MTHVIVGAGPTGLGAAERLRQLGHDDLVVLEASETVGGLARSVTDRAGYTYDIGGHVLFSGYEEYRRLLDELIGDDATELVREAWVWMEERYIPYPFQSHFGGLAPATVYECLAGLLRTGDATGDPRDLREWVHAVFGDGIARHFMLPYNWKVWATPPERMGFGWIADRVPVVDVEAVLSHVLFGRERRSWGPNATFRYPLRGGTGYVWERLAERVGDRLERRSPVVRVDPRGRVVVTGDGRRWRYEALLSTVPLDELVAMCGDVPVEVVAAARQLVASGTHVVAVALDRPTDTTRNWIYYPEPDVPFYRVTYLSNYSPALTPRPGQTLLLTETSTSRWKPEDPRTIVERVVAGLRHVGVLAPEDEVAHTWRLSVDKTYPVPTLGRDEALASIEPWLASHGIASRGRFGAWRYEIGNMDHGYVQGRQWAERVLTGAPERVWTPAGSPAVT